MNWAESYFPSKDIPTTKSRTSWEAIRDNYPQPEYQTFLSEVPLWGKELLTDLYDHHEDSFFHSVRTSLAVKNVLDKSLQTGDASSPYIEEVPYKKIMLGALLHDVGKMYVSRAVLDKPGQPTDEEWEHLQQHSVTGYEIVKPHDDILATLVGGHHLHQGERSYGPLEAKPTTLGIIGAQHIIAAVDVADALGSKRSYKDSMSPDMVREIMLREKNFSPRLISYAIDGRFAMPPFVTASEEGSLSREQTIFQR